MPQCPRSEQCAHLFGMDIEIGFDSQGDVIYRGVCRSCRRCGPNSQTEDRALRGYYSMLFGEQQEEITNLVQELKTKETNMAQTRTYEQGYRQGILDVTSRFTSEEEYSTRRGDSILISDVYKIFEDRAKKLLTKKVTKWYNLWGSGNRVELGQNWLYDSESEARGTAEGLRSTRTDKYYGAYAAEIEVPL